VEELDFGVLIYNNLWRSGLRCGNSSTYGHLAYLTHLHVGVAAVSFADDAGSTGVVEDVVVAVGGTSFCAEGGLGAASRTG